MHTAYNRFMLIGSVILCYIPKLFPHVHMILSIFLYESMRKKIVTFHCIPYCTCIVSRGGTQVCNMDSMSCIQGPCTLLYRDWQFCGQNRLLRLCPHLHHGFHSYNAVPDPSHDVLHQSRRVVRHFDRKDSAACSAVFLVKYDVICSGEHLMHT